MWADLVTLMPWPTVSATVNPRTTIQLFELIRNPLHGVVDVDGVHPTGPVIVTVDPGASAKVIGSACVPELVTVTCSA